MTRAAVALCALTTVVSSALAAGAIFPAPIHITREVHDPVSDKTIVFNEYAYGNRLVSVRGHLTAIADYEKGELTEIDRSAGTYSVTRFETIAKAAKAAGGGEAAAQKERRAPVSMAPRATRSGRPADFFRSESESSTVEVAVDRSVRVSREALEILVGAAYPNTRNEQHDVVIAAARGGRLAVAGDADDKQATYALPLEQVFVTKFDREQLELRNSVVRVGNEPPPADLLAIPPGARLVVSRTASVLRELEQLDAPPLRPPDQP